MKPSIALLALLAGVVPAPVRAQSNDVSSYILFALQELRTKGIRVTGNANIGVNARNGILTASSGNEIDAPQSQVVADLVRASDQSRCGHLFANAVLRPMAACGPETPARLPLVENPGQACGFPNPFPASPEGGCSENVRMVPNGTTTVLPPGTYGDVRVFSGGQLVLTGGSQPYFFCSLRAGRSARILAQQAATIRVLGTVNLSDSTSFGPDPSAEPPVAPGDVRLIVAGPSVHFSSHSDVRARLCAPNALLRITHNASIDGSFLARTIRTERIMGGSTTTTTTSSTTSTSPGKTTTTTTSGKTTTTSGKTTTTTSGKTTTTTSGKTTTTTTPGKACPGNIAVLCGNGHIDCAEQCDGADFGTHTCPGGSTAGQFLKCRTDCTIDYSGCPCGNGIKEASEECDPVAVPTGCPADKTCGASNDAATACRCITKEICGNCIDDDGNGLTDFEDPACCPRQQTFQMAVTRGRLRPRGGTSKLVLRSILGSAGLENVNPLTQDVFVQIRQPGGAELLCAHAPAAKFMNMHHAFKFWDRKHQVASAKGIQDIKVVPPRKKRRDTRFRTFGKKVEIETPAGGSLQVTVGFHDPTTEGGNICASQVQAFRTGPKGRLRAP